MNYTLRQLTVFQKVVETSSITRAAELLHMTQPAVSIQLRNFQDNFDIPLTQIVGRQLHITEFGLEIASLGAEILGRVDGMGHRALAFKGIMAGTLRLASASTGKYVLPYFLSDFMRRHPGVDLVVNVTNRQTALRELEDNQIDMALVSVLPDGLGVEEEKLISNDLYLVTGAKGPWSNMNWDQLGVQVPLIFREAGSATRKSMERYLNQNGVEVRKKLELSSNEAVKQALVAGLGVSILPLIGIRHELASGELKLIHQPDLPLSYGMEAGVADQQGVVSSCCGVYS
ncbi:MAG: LysR family transcriptional regulator, partial [Cytophagales bacterium]|nr:LysR family transcriptional regulator [Cytophagales bacterium]